MHQTMKNLAKVREKPQDKMEDRDLKFKKEVPKENPKHRDKVKTAGSAWVVTR